MRKFQRRAKSMGSVWGALAVAALCATMVLAARGQGTKSEVQELLEAMKLEPMGLASDLAKIDEQFREMEKLIAGEAGSRQRAGKVSRWSVGQHVLHLAKATDLIAGQIETLLAEPELNADQPAKPIREMVLQGGQIPRGRGKSPDAIAVHYQPDAAEVREGLAGSRERWSRVAARAEAIERSRSKIEHFAFGPLTASDWVRFNAIHNGHHLSIVRDILADAEAREAKPS